jgi:hypothetical protein
VGAPSGFSGYPMNQCGDINPTLLSFAWRIQEGSAILAKRVAEPPFALRCNPALVNVTPSSPCANPA